MSYAPLALLSGARPSFSRSVSSPTAVIKEEGGQGAPISPPAANGQIVLPQPKPTQKSPEYISAPLPSSMDVKSQRTYEHARQSMKKAADLVKMRAQKTHSPKSLKVGAPAGGMESILKRDVDIVDWEGIPVEKREAWGPRHVSDARYEAKLVDLVAAPRPRRQRRGDSDFEVIPHVRSVIVLDDIPPSVLPVEEPWEHIYPEDSESEESSASEAGRTYANVLASSN